MNCYIVELTYGRMVVDGISLPSVSSKARREHGTNNIKAVRRADISELVDIKRMGGWIPFEFRDAVEAEEVRLYPPKPGHVRGYGKRVSALSRATGGETA
jgi:hypothetical protein